MKLILIAIFLLSSTEIYAKANMLLQCLAKEEEKFHKKKVQDALYRLNQTFLNELASNNDINIKQNFVEEICSKKHISPSVEFLHLLLIKEADIYDISLSSTESSMRPYKMGYINEFQKQVPHMLISYISGLQSETSDPKCIARSIPEINYFIEKIKYLEEEISVHKIMSDKKKLETIFRKLRNFEAIKAKCESDYFNKMRLIEKRNQKARTGKDI